MADEKDAYREELAAAHARIAALEADLGSRSGATADRKIAELEKQRSDLARAADPKQVRKLAGLFALVPVALFGSIGLGIYLTTGFADALTLVFMGAFIGALLGVVHAFITPSGTRAALAKVDRELEEAKRIARLETEVHETRRLLEAALPPTRVRVEGEEIEDERPSEEERRSRTR